MAVRTVATDDGIKGCVSDPPRGRFRLAARHVRCLCGGRSFDRTGRDRHIKEHAMRLYRWIQRSLPFATVALVSATSVASAQWDRVGDNRGQELFEWIGGVDREVQIVMRGNRLWTNEIGRTEPGNDRSRTFSALPRQDVEVVVQVLNGRGDVDVIQQPDARNGYSTVIRIRDARAGADRYRVAAYFRNQSNGDVYGRNGNGRAADRSHGQRGDEMRRRDRDNDDDRDGRFDRDNRGRNGDLASRSLMRWSGNVDHEIEIRIQNGRVDTRTVAGNQPTGVRVNAANSSTPRSSATLNVAVSSGRGSVQVVQQPSSWNGYTTVIRVRDPQGGYGFYDFDLIW
jgi:hypothetical protein